MRLSAVGAGDGLDDRQAEPAAAVAMGRGCAAETLEGTTDEFPGEALAAVQHMQLDRPVPGLGAQLDGPGPIAQGVVDHAPDRLVEAQAVGVEIEAGGRAHLDRPPPLLGAAREAAANA